MKKIFKMFSAKDVFYALLAVVFIVLQVWLDLTMPDYTAGLTEAVSGGNLTMSVILKNGRMMLIMMFIMLPRVIVSSKRISEVLNTEPSIRDGESLLVGGKNKNAPSVEFRNVSFSYSGLGSENVLENINLTVNKGETLAIVGATGSGKTTMIDLLTRVYDVTSGEILVDGVNVKDYKESDLQDKIAVTSQKAMDKLTEGRTSFVIAHRLSTVKNADIILVLKDGDIIESGTHEELLDKKGFYAELYNSQFASVS